MVDFHGFHVGKYTIHGSYGNKTAPTTVALDRSQVAGLLGLRQLKAAVDGPEEFQLQPGSLQGKNVLITGPDLRCLEGRENGGTPWWWGFSFCMFIDFITLDNSDYSDDISKEWDAREDEGAPLKQW